MKLKIYISVFLGVLFGLNIQAQSVAVKTNFAGWATATPNIGLEVGISKKSSIDLYGSFNPFRFGNGKQWKHWFVQPEYRYWFCERFNGHFLGFHLVGGEYNLAKINMPFGAYPNLETTRYQGWGVGAGIAYGYQWPISRHWALEATIGVGYIYGEYDRFPCAECGTKLESGNKHYFGPTKVAINMIYAF